MPWRIEMLGGLTVVHAERRISRFQTQKTGALLAYLALHPGKSHAREAIAEILWPEGDPIAIRNRLNQAISSLRRQLHPPELGPGNVLVTDHHSIGINVQTVVTDTEEFEREIRLAERAESLDDKIKFLEQAVGRYKGELLEGYYEEWVFSKRIHLADLYDKALQELIRSQVAAGNPEGAIDPARRRLQLDPYDEAPHVILMRLYLRAGRPKSALKQYEDLSRALQQFDDEPSDHALKYKVKAEALANDQAVEGDLDESFDDTPIKKSPVETPIAAAPIQSNLPRVVSTFVGREAEMAEVIARVTERDERLISILGLGGFGKTRLAIEAGWALLDEFDSRVFFVPLANTHPNADVTAEFGRAIQPENENNRLGAENFVERLNALGSTLAIFDNFEHMSEDAANKISELLAKAPALRILVTSRVPLNIEGETQINLLPLPLPDRQERDLKAISANPTIALFVERAQAVKADFQLTERTAVPIIELANQLEGLPLALELAASWARILTPSQMLERIRSNVDHLESRRKDANPRHRTLRAAFEGSYDLLDGELRSLFLGLTVFTGGWDLESAEAVCQAGDLLTGMQRLEERSLIQSVPTEVTIRFSMLETIRQFGASHLLPDAHQVLSERHASYFLQLAEGDGSYDEWASRIAPGYANCLAALTWFESTDSAEEAARLAVALSRYWEGTGLFAEACHWLEKVVLNESVSDETSIRAKIALGSILWFAGEFEQSKAVIDSTIDSATRLNLRESTIRGSFIQQLEAHRVGNYDEAKRILWQILDLAKNDGDDGVIARIYLALGNAELELEDYNAAQANYERSLESARRTLDPTRIGPPLTNLANLAAYRGQLEAARTWSDEAIAAGSHSKHHWLKSMSLIVKARIENELGNFVRAGSTALSAYRTAPNEKLVVWRFLIQFGFALLGLGMKSEAIRVFGYCDAYRERAGERHRGLEIRRFEQQIREAFGDPPSPEFVEQFAIGKIMSREDLEGIIAKAQRAFSAPLVASE